MCYSYQEKPALQDLCDEEGALKLLNVQGSCFVDHDLLVDQTAFESEFGTPVVFTLGVDPV